MRIIHLVVIYMALVLPIWAHGDDVGFSLKQESIPISEATQQALNIETNKVEEFVIDDLVQTTGEIEEIPENHFDINSPVQGKVISIQAVLGDKVEPGQTLAIIQSTDIASLQAEIDKLKAELELAESNFNRSKLLYEKGITPEKEYLAAKAVLSSQKAKLNAAQSKLKILTQGSSGQGDGIFALKAQKAGTIVEKNITIGQMVNPNDLLFHGIDLTTVWVSANIYEKDIAKVKQGQEITAVLDGLPDKVFTARLSFVDSVVNQDTRTLAVKAVVENTEALLKPGQFLQLSIHTGIKRKSIIIARTALVEMDKGDVDGKHKHLVYLKSKDKYVPREIEVQNHVANTVEVISGLQAGEELITQGAYQLQFGEGEDEHEHRHKHSNKNNDSVQNYLLIILSAIIFSLIGFLLGRRKSNG